MTAGLLGKTFSEQPTTSPPAKVDNVVTARLTRLAPLHRRAAMRQAQAVAGLFGGLPTIADLRTAECPPAEVWRVASVSYDTGPTRAAVSREAARVMADLTWRAALPHMPRRDLERLARRLAEERLEAARVPGVQERHELMNGAEVAAGHALAVMHGPLLAALGGILNGLDRHVEGAGLAALPEDGIVGMADEAAAQAQAAWEWRGRLAHSAGRPVPGLTPHDRRQQDPVWWRRQLRRKAGLARQHLAAALGTVGRDGSPYADDYSLTCRRDRDAAADAWADAHVWQPPGGGAAIPMAQLRAGSDTARLHRIGAMTAGLDEVAKREGLVPIMCTLTLPPEWHPAPAVGRRTWTADRGPEATDQALRGRWTRFRARLAKSGIRPLGLRVWEPHKDGTPHAHALLYVREDEIGTVDRHLQQVCPEPAPGRRVASTLVVIDRERSRGSTYVMKYLRKTIGTAPAGDDAASGAGEDDHLAGDHHDRTRATASERRWRRFATLGVHGLQRVWQRVLTATEEEVAMAPGRVREARAALDGNRWADALDAMGALRRPGADRLRLGYDFETVDMETGEILPLLDRYGTPCRRAAWLLDTGTPTWRVPLGRGGTIEAVRRVRTDEETDAEAIRQQWREARERLGWHLEGGAADKPLVFNGVTVSISYARSEDSTDANDCDDNEFCCELSTNRVFLAGTGPPDPAELPVHPMAA